MKIISISDVHMATRNLNRMREVMRDADLVIVAGDLTNFGGIEDARKVLDAVRAQCKNVLAVPGNLDQPETFAFFEREGIALHGNGIVIEGIGIFGCGGSNISPFKTPSEFSEDEIYAVLRRGYEAVSKVRPLLMVCHPPPFETKCDRITSGKAVGSPAARKFIEEFAPDVCICGHIHESAGVDKIGPTAVLNAGAFKGRRLRRCREKRRSGSRRDSKFSELSKTSCSQLRIIEATQVTGLCSRFCASRRRNLQSAR